MSTTVQTPAVTYYNGRPVHDPAEVAELARREAAYAYALRVKRRPLNLRATYEAMVATLADDLIAHAARLDASEDIPLTFAEFVETGTDCDDLPSFCNADPRYMQPTGRTYGGACYVEKLDDGSHMLTLGRDSWVTGQGVTLRDLESALYRWAVSEGLISTPQATLEAVGEAFASALVLALGPDRMRDVAAKNATAAYANSCASHDHCDANVVMADVLQDFDIDAASNLDDAETVALWNDAWNFARGLIASRFAPTADRVQAMEGNGHA